MVIINKFADKLLHAFWISDLYYYFQPINGDTDNVHMQGDTSGFISALWYHSKSSLHQKNELCKQAVRSNWMYVLKAKLFHTKRQQNYQRFC